MLDWVNLEKTCLSCVKCGLCETRHNVVFGVGNPQADILFIGEGLKWFDIALTIITSVIGMYSVAAGLSGYFFKRMNIIERLLAIGGGLCMIIPGTLTDIIGLGAIALVVLFQFIFHKNKAAA